MNHDIGPESRVRIAASVYARNFGEEIVLLDFGRGEYFGLEPIGAEIWRRIESGDSLAQIADWLVERYEVARDDALCDAVDLVRELSRHALVNVS